MILNLNLRLSSLILLQVNQTSRQVKMMSIIDGSLRFNALYGTFMVRKCRNQRTSNDTKNETGSVDPLKLLYPIDHIISVRNYGLNRMFVAGEDYDVVDKKLVIYDSGKYLSRHCS